MNKHLIYTTDDDFSLFIFKTPEEFKVYNLELQDNQSGLTYKLASYSGGRYNINPYAYEKFMKYVISCELLSILYICAEQQQRVA